MSDQKQCTKCGSSFPRTSEFFHKDSSKTDGLYPRCRICRDKHLPGSLQVIAQARRLAKEAERAERKIKQEGRDLVKQLKAEARAQEKLDNPPPPRSQKEARLQWEKDHPEEYQAGLARKREAQKARRKANPQRYIDYQDNYRKSNPEKAKMDGRMARARRRARELNAEGSFTKSDVAIQLQTQKAKCWWCSCDIANGYQVDHIIPLTRGGSNWPSNLVLSCEHCNKSRGSKLPHEWNGKLI